MYVKDYSCERGEVGWCSEGVWQVGLPFIGNQAGPKYGTTPCIVSLTLFFIFFINLSIHLRFSSRIYPFINLLGTKLDSSL